MTGSVIRKQAAIELKNLIKNNKYPISPEIKTYIQNKCIQCLSSKEKTLRDNVAIIISSFVSLNGVANSTNLLNSLVSSMEAEQNLDALNGKVNTFRTILEDNEVGFFDKSFHAYEFYYIIFAIFTYYLFIYSL